MRKIAEFLPIYPKFVGLSSLTLRHVNHVPCGQKAFFGGPLILMKHFDTRFTVLALCVAALIGCRGPGGSPIPGVPVGTTCNAAIGQYMISGTCIFPCPVASAPTNGGSPAVVSSCSPATSQPSVAPLTSPTPLASATPLATATPTPTPTPSPLGGDWSWTSIAGQIFQIEGVLPNIPLINAASGPVTISTFATDVVTITNNTCPSSFGVLPGNNGLITFTVNNPVTSCSFTATDPSTGYSVNVVYTNTP